MARQSDVMDKAVRDFVRIIDRGGGSEMQIRCGSNLSVAIQRSETTGNYDQIIMYSYNSPIARACLSNKDDTGDVKVELNVWYYNFSSTTSRHLTYFLSALYYALPMSRAMFDRRAKRANLEWRAYEAAQAVDLDARLVWFVL